MPRKRRSPYETNKTSERLAWLRDSLWGGSQIDMASETGVYQGTLSNILLGKRKPGSDLLERIAKHPRINRSWLLTGEGDPFVEGATAPVAGEAALHVAREPFVGSPHDNPEYLEHYLLPVHRSLFRPSRYWVIVGDGHSLVEDDSVCIAVGDQVLFEPDTSGWPTKLAGHPCIVLAGRGQEVSLGFHVVPNKPTTESKRPGKPQKLGPGEREQRVIMLDPIFPSEPEPSSSRTPMKKRSGKIVAVGIYREGAF